jgi:class III poly(R)-hydroxyalkanoic acid synthase PhaE subunit
MSEQERQRRHGAGAADPAADWVRQSEALGRAWVDAQSRMWSDWMAVSMPAAAGPARFMGDWVQQWQTLARSMSSPSQDESGEKDEIVQRILSGEQTFLSFVDTMFAMMRAISPGIDVGEEWTTLMQRFLDQMREDVLSGKSSWLHPEGLVAASADLTELWRLYTAELQRAAVPWASAYADAALHFADASRGDPHAMRKTFVGFLDAYEVTFGRFLSSPSVGYSRESSERLLRGFDAWVDMSRAAADFQTELANTGLHAIEQLVKRLVDMSETGEQVTSLRQLFDLWVDTVDAAYVELFGSDSFTVLQGRFVNTTMIFRQRQAELLDEMMEALGLPGRKEVDEIHRHMHDLRRELRYAKRELKALRREFEARDAAQVEPPKKAKAGKTKKSGGSAGKSRQREAETGQDAGTP